MEKENLLLHPSESAGKSCTFIASVRVREPSPNGHKFMAFESIILKAYSMFFIFFIKTSQ